MNQKNLSRWLKAVLIGMALCGAAVCFLIIPAYGKSLVSQYPEFSNRYRPWLFFLWLTALPCFAALVFGWRLASNLGRGRSFCMENARALQWIAWLAAGDAAFFFIGNAVLLFANMSHPGIVLLSWMVVFAGVAVAIAAAVLSHLAAKGAELQAENDLTI